ncbi:MAG: iron-containing alcohol dehydrogenase [Candidatus Aureabacteria bacterium]|nr:iron-containing alcohol dehydrogenase [Candidatus Auribacterota bacterium]
MRFEFATATRIIFGPGTLTEASPLAATMGGRACVVTGRSTDRAMSLLEQLHAHGVDTITFAVAGEPTTSLAIEGVRLARGERCDVVIGIGGGSVLDTGKAIAALLTNSGDLTDYLEVVGKGTRLGTDSAPFIAIPTTAGTGAEATSNAVLCSPEHRVKVSMRHPLMLPKVALVDPLLTHSMPPALTASTGLDALTQLVEPFVSPYATPLTDAVCRKGMRRAARSLKRACENGADATAREEMALASLFGGLALSNARLGAVHGFAGPIGGMVPAPHGALCARLLAPVMEANIRALRSRAPHSPALARYDEAAQILTGDPDARADDGVAWAREIVAILRIPSLSSLGVREAQIAGIPATARASSSMKGNPIELTDAELESILRNAF